MPDTILDENGKQITWQELKRGNLLDIYGDGIMLESYPGQYPGVTRIKVVSREILQTLTSIRILSTRSGPQGILPSFPV